MYATKESYIDKKSGSFARKKNPGKLTTRADGIAVK
jgi:hypothetical protein